MRIRGSIVGAIVVSATAVTALSGCGGSSNTTSPSHLHNYVAAVERVRLPVNTLLNGADPILDAYHAHTITPAVASQRMGALESGFAGYALAMQQIAPKDKALRTINAGYAHTYFLEDSYLATLSSDLVDGDFDNLPDTQDAQRLTIIEWRIQLEQIAATMHLTLPADIQQAGRGEIAPGIDGR